MAAILIAQALIQEIAPKSIQHHVEARDFLREQEATNPCGLVAGLVHIYNACQGNCFQPSNEPLAQVIEKEIQNEYQVGRPEIRLLCLISLRTIWQRQTCVGFQSHRSSGFNFECICTFELLWTLFFLNFDVESENECRRTPKLVFLDGGFESVHF
eukprot:Gregarina_sp_Poly_1__5631@NODE_296_length_9847_cov_43_256544_g256_i0_p8_GENE_NODE_296_length_9847_cov_43_256544_g256_i0NODE_296_length_9847_cov_43_256544_g256_i0_p8_ORF_typecomplete_len156_score16_13KH_10/PF17905_1/0_16KH_10/PF17905_1/9_3e03_NODE_296_length_9847_cov_43_256544_g256_i079718438